MGAEIADTMRRDDHRLGRANRLRAGVLGADHGVGAAPFRPTLRTVIGGARARLLTHLIGGFFHVSGSTAETRTASRLTR